MSALKQHCGGAQSEVHQDLGADDLLEAALGVESSSSLRGEADAMAESSAHSFAQGVEAGAEQGIKLALEMGFVLGFGACSRAVLTNRTPPIDAKQNSTMMHPTTSTTSAQAKGREAKDKRAMQLIQEVEDHVLSLPITDVSSPSLSSHADAARGKFKRLSSLLQSAATYSSQADQDINF